MPFYPHTIRLSRDSDPGWDNKERKTAGAPWDVFWLYNPYWEGESHDIEPGKSPLWVAYRFVTLRLHKLSTHLLPSPPFSDPRLDFIFLSPFCDKFHQQKAISSFIYFYLSSLFFLQCVPVSIFYFIVYFLRKKEKILKNAFFFVDDDYHLKKNTTNASQLNFFFSIFPPPSSGIFL